MTRYRLGDLVESSAVERGSPEWDLGVVVAYMRDAVRVRWIRAGETYTEDLATLRRVAL